MGSLVTTVNNGRGERVKTLYCYPVPSEENEYIFNQSAAWELAGFKVHYVPGYLKKVLSPSLQGDVLVLNWFEDRVSHSKAPAIEFLRSLVIFLILRAKFKKVVVVSHNFLPHSGKGVFFYRILKSIIQKLATSTLSHRPIESCTHFLHHPEYKLSLPQTVSSNGRWLVFGAVKRYKCIPKLLTVWPLDVPLLMVGKAENEKLTHEIQAIINERGLNVEWVNAFVSKEDLDQYIAASKGVVLPHADHAMVVSGTFYHASSIGKPVLAIESDFSAFLASEFSFVIPFTYRNINTVIPTSDEDNRESIRAEFLAKCSIESLSSGWNKILN